MTEPAEQATVEALASAPAERAPVAAQVI